MCINVYICEDNMEFAENIQKFLPKMGDINILGHSISAESGLDDKNLFKADVLILDLEMPGKGGLWMIQELAKLKNIPDILVLTSFTSEDTVFLAIKYGASGYLVKGAALKKILNAINDISKGGIVIEPVLATRFWSFFTSCIGRKEKDPYSLTEVELDVLELVAKGLSNPEVGSALGRSRNNVKKILSRIYVKMGVNTRVEACRLGFKTGIIEL
jgi:DNA-binding NarL/FixJ family response regulator